MKNSKMQKLIRKKLNDLEAERKALIAFSDFLKEYPNNYNFKPEVIKNFIFNKDNTLSFCFYHNPIHIETFLYEYDLKFYNKM